MPSSPLYEVIRHGVKMRKAFSFHKYSVAQWFPGHMGKGMNQVLKKLKFVDCVVEIHDARIPISGRNPIFQRDIAQFKPYLLVLNKEDLIGDEEKSELKKYYKEKFDTDILLTNCKENVKQSLKMLVPLITEKIKHSERYHRTYNEDYCVMIIGVPNVGKSSIINSLRNTYLRKRNATAVGASPGITRSVLEKIKISEDPLIYVLDTPGIMAPRIGNIEVGLKLALCNTLKDHLVGEEIIADYLLYRLNCNGNHKYVDIMKLDEPTDDIQKALFIHCCKTGRTLKVRSYSGRGGMDIVPNYKRAAQVFLKYYREGHFGSLNLDSDKLMILDDR